jgi:hypothetical protein
MKVRVAVLGVLAAAVLAGPARACPPPVAYPGDDAVQTDVAGWMAHGALAAGLPGELPVMGSLVASGLKNLSGGDRDEVGYFQMRVGIWNAGPYQGFPDHPELQLQWFIDQALGVRERYLAQGMPDPVLDELRWGDWIADVLRPAEPYRGRYQLRLAEARALIGPACPGEAPAGGSQPAPAGAPPAALPDTTPPLARLSGPRDQHPLRRGALLVKVTCPAEACAASATGTLRLPGRAHALRLRAKPLALGQGQTLTLRLALSAAARSAVGRALRVHRALKAKLLVTVADTIGNASTAARTVRLAL